MALYLAQMYSRGRSPVVCSVSATRSSSSRPIVVPAATDTKNE
jgi:hypothetical protein